LAAAPSSEASQARPSLRTALLAGAAVAALAVVYPWTLGAVLERAGARGLALLLLGALAVSLPLRGPAVGSRRLGTAGLVVLLVASAATGDARWLRLVPAWVYLGLAVLFAKSLREPGSLIERAARWLVPEAPAFIRDYCRVVTALWVVCFLAFAAQIVWLAFAGDPGAWTRFTSRSVWIAMGAFSAVEFLVRKTWFRYYFHGGPFDRLWSRLFPAERTARGRRSLAYIEEYRARLTSRPRPGCT
jgi:uncharacterized membrane protein